VEVERFRFNENSRHLVPTEVELKEILNRVAASVEPDEDDIERLVCYIMAHSESLSQDELDEKLNTLILDSIMEGLVNKGMLDADISGPATTYMITDKGRQEMEQIIKEHK